VFGFGAGVVYQVNRMNDDAALLRRYAEEGSEAAFTELVGRHVDLVYGAALRRTGDPHRAADVAQQVFTKLAHEARKLSRHTVLAAWLHTATRNAALNLMISEQRRLVRESAALALDAGAGGVAPDWDRLRPLLDAAIDELPETDRAAVVLRFLEHRPFAEIGNALQVTEDAARMRTDRALDKLRAALARRGITSTAAALAVVVTGQPLLSAPTGLAAAVATQALELAGPGFFAATLASFMTAKIITTAALSALVAFGAGAYVGFNHDTDVSASTIVPDQSRLVASLRQDNQRLAAAISGLNADIARLNATNAGLDAKPVAPPPAPAVAPKSPNIGGTLYELQGAILNNLRQIDAARNQFQTDTGHPAASIHDLVGIRRYIKTVRTVGGEEYSGLSMTPGGPLTVTTPDGVSVTYDPAGALTTKPDIPPAVLRVRELGQRLQVPAMKAVEAYRAAHNGANPPNEAAVLPYFATPQEGADYAEFMEARIDTGL
jgi:RNA polymerase sigma factor (sigma-70 family)